MYLKFVCLFVCLYVCLFGPIEGHAFQQMAAVLLLGKHMLGNNSHHKVSDTVPGFSCGVAWMVSCL